ncbi:hypothetical protein AwDysgo_18340 [Bacteroidales bacterium]|nr:hypothetical protein AwDysgo_18340 [Bacteroidales bacterium]
MAACFQTVAAQSIDTATDSSFVLTENAVPNDTLAQKNKDSNAIDAPVVYSSTDSIVMTGSSMIFLYGEGNVEYKEMALSGEYIEVDADKSEVTATFGLDSIGNEMGFPVFKEGDAEYEMKKVRYNFKTKKAIISDVITQQGEGYVTAGRTKKMDTGELNMIDGKYTTCDNHDHPHFYIKMTKAKVRPGKNIVTGPVYLVIADVPLPLALPFGFFPFSSSYSSGVIMPTYADEMNRGFGLREGGYYFAFNDYIDMALTGEIYTKGSWGLNTRSTYKKRYKFSGNFDLGYLVTINGDKDSPDYSKAADIKIRWSHSQAAEADPYRRISASVDFSTSSYSRNDLNSVYGSRYTDNVKSSSVNISQSFPNNPLTINASMRASQRTKDSTLSLTLPDLSIAYPQTYPFRRKNPIGKAKWYESIYFSYAGSLKNSVTTKDNMLFQTSLVKDWKNAMQHSIPVSASFNLLKYINISPSINYNSRWYTNKVEQGYSYLDNTISPIDTTYGFYRVYDYSAGVSMNTKMYGFFKPWSIFGEKVEMIRHVLTPTVSFSGSPDFGASQYGYWREVRTPNSDQSTFYSPFKDGLFGVPGQGKTGSLSFGFTNNVEMKVKSDSDSTGVKKISLIDNLSMGMSYNFLAKETPWSNLSTNLRLKLSKSYTLNLSATFDTYTYKLNENDRPIKDMPRWEAGKGIGRLMNTGTSFSYNFTNESLRQLFSKKDKKDTGENKTEGLDREGEDGEETSDSGTKASLRGAKKDDGDFDASGYMIMNIPWSLSANYNIGLNYDNQKFNKEKLEYDYKITQTLGISGNISPTKGWQFNFSTSYDFDNKNFAMMNCGITRNLHCWQMSGNFIPIGPYQSYMFTLSVSSSLLQDLKYNQSSSMRDAMKWE